VPPVPISSPSADPAADDRDAGDRAAFEADGNPVHAIMAFLRYRPGEPLPEWVHRYLRQALADVARLVLDHTVAPAEVCQRLPGAMGLVQTGKNQVKVFRQRRDDSLFAAAYVLAADPKRPKESRHKLAQRLKMKEDTLRKRVARGKIWSKRRRPTP
jgi:hypothetical protein